MPRILDITKPKIVLLDNDGTCMPYHFFASDMQPLLTNTVVPYLAANWDSPIVQDIILRMRVEYQRKIPAGLKERTLIPEDNGTNQADVMQKAYHNFITQMDEGKKSETTIALAWLIWLDEFQKGNLKGHLFPDVPGAFKDWKDHGITICIISHMISLGQQLLFTCSNWGCVDELVDGYLCTKDLGTSKNKEGCYLKILKEKFPEVKPKELLFLTDSGREAVAAKNANCRSILVERVGNLRIDEKYLKDFNVISSFSQLNFV